MKVCHHSWYSINSTSKLIFAMTVKNILAVRKRAIHGKYILMCSLLIWLLDKHDQSNLQDRWNSGQNGSEMTFKEVSWCNTQTLTAAVEDNKGLRGVENAADRQFLVDERKNLRPISQVTWYRMAYSALHSRPCSVARRLVRRQTAINILMTSCIKHEFRSPIVS